MLRISSSFGIVISMYWNEGGHQVPHFHAEYGEEHASVAFDGTILEGDAACAIVAVCAGVGAATPSRTQTELGSRARPPASGPIDPLA